MTLSLYTTTSGTTTQLNDSLPFRLESAEGLSGSDVVRYEQRGPYQSGVTDLGFRLQARTITLNLLFYASTAVLLDTYRSTLMAAFKPLDSTSISLSAQRDDSEIRTLTCFTVGDIDIELVPEEYPGHLHRATVNLRAASPLWQASAVTTGSTNWNTLTSWWLAGGSISATNVKNHYTYPAADTAVNPFSGTITGDWSVAFVTAKDTSGNLHYVFADGTGGSASFYSTPSGTVNFTDNAAGYAATGWAGTTDYNYHVVESRSGTQYWRYWNNNTLTVWNNTVDAGTATYDYTLHGGSFFTLRGHRLSSGSAWTPEIRKIAIFGTVTTAQLQALGPYMLNGLIGGTVNIVNDGDVYAYPLITIYGPMSNPVIVNTTTAGTLDLTGITLSAADIMTIDLRTGNKQIVNQNGTNLLGSVTTLPASLASFSLAPSPIASGGTNTIVLTPGSAGSAAIFGVQITNQYMSF